MKRGFLNTDKAHDVLEKEYPAESFDRSPTTQTRATMPLEPGLVSKETEKERLPEPDRSSTTETHPQETETEHSPKENRTTEGKPDG